MKEDIKNWMIVFWCALLIIVFVTWLFFWFEFVAHEFKMIEYKHEKESCDKVKEYWLNIPFYCKELLDNSEF